MNNTKGITVKINNHSTKIEFTRNDGVHVLGLWDTPFKALQTGKKGIEVRTNTKEIPFDFNSIKENDSIEFVNELTGERVLTNVVQIYHYNTTEDYLKEHGFKHSSANPNTIEEAIDAIEKHTGYKVGIKKHGLYAFRLEIK